MFNLHPPFPPLLDQGGVTCPLPPLRTPLALDVFRRFCHTFRLWCAKKLRFSTSFALRFWSLQPRLLTYRNFTHLFGIDRPTLGNMFSILCPQMALSYFKNMFFTKFAKKLSFFLKIVITLT